MTEYAKSFGAKGLAFIKVEGGEWKSPIVKFFSEAEKAALKSKLAIEEGDLILFAADQWLNACEILGKIRLYCAEVLRGQGKLTIDPKRFDFLWVVEFPLLSFDKEFEVVAHVPNGAMALQELEHGVSVNRPACGRVRDTFGFAVSFEGADARRSAGVERR